MFLSRFRRALVAGVATTALAIAAASYASGPIHGNIEAFLINNDGSGSESIEVASQAEPGDVIEYRLVFTNSGEADVFGLNVVNPIPDNTSFIEQSAMTAIPSTFMVSIDGGETFESTPVTRIETQADGSQKEVVVPPSLYTHVQWKAEEALPSSGGMHTYAYRVQIN